MVCILFLFLTCFHVNVAHSNGNPTWCARVSKLRHHVFPPKINACILCIHVLCKTQRSLIRSFYVAKCNLAKVNLEAMLVSSFPSHTRSGPMPLAEAPRDSYMQLLACSSSQSVVAIACCLHASLCFGFACLLFLLVQ